MLLPRVTENHCNAIYNGRGTVIITDCVNNVSASDQPKEHWTDKARTLFSAVS